MLARLRGIKKSLRFYSRDISVAAGPLVWFTVAKQINAQIITGATQRQAKAFTF